MNCMAEDHIGGSPVADRSNTDAVGIWKSVARQKDRARTEIGIKNGADVMDKTEDMCIAANTFRSDLFRELTERYIGDTIGPTICQ